MQRITSNGLVFYQFDSFLRDNGLFHGVFTRLGGVSPAPFASLNVGSTVGDNLDCVRVNRERMASAFDVQEEDIRTTWQVHGAEVLVVDDRIPQDWPPPKADGIITTQRDMPLVMRFADCVPLAFYDPVCQVIGLGHAGWRSTVAGIGPAVVAAMQENFGSHPQDILVGIGPSIGPCCYEVGSEVVDQFRAAFPEPESFFRSAENGSGDHLDLWTANEYALRRAGIVHIEVSQLCTSCNTDEFYSHRAEDGRTGRFGLMLGLRGE